MILKVRGDDAWSKLIQLPGAQQRTTLIPLPVSLSNSHQFHKAFMLVIEILWKFLLIQFCFYWLNQVTILHMSRQLSCRAMCKIVTWYQAQLSWHVQNCDLILFFRMFEQHVCIHNVSIMSSKPLVKWIPGFESRLARTDVLVKVSKFLTKFLTQKMSRPEGDQHVYIYNVWIMSSKPFANWVPGFGPRLACCFQHG